jgi:hypothetical protein
MATISAVPLLALSPVRQVPIDGAPLVDATYFSQEGDDESSKWRLARTRSGASSKKNLETRHRWAHKPD